MTVTDLVARTRELIEDPSATFISDANLKLQLEELARDFTRRTRCVRKVNEALAFTSKTVTLPTDCLDVTRLYYGTRELDPLGISDLSPLEFLMTGEPRNYIRELTGPDSLTLWPDPATSGTLKLYYVHGHCVSGSATPTIEIPDRYQAALPYGTAARILLMSGNESDAAHCQIYQQTYERYVEEAHVDAANHFDINPRRIPYNRF